MKLLLLRLARLHNRHSSCNFRHRRQSLHLILQVQMLQVQMLQVQMLQVHQ